MPCLVLLSALFAGLNKDLSDSKARQDIEWINGTIDKPNNKATSEDSQKELRLSPEGSCACALVEIHAASSMGV